MKQVNTTIQHLIQELRYKQQLNQKEIKFAFEKFQNQVKSLKSLKLPKKNLKDNQIEKSQKNNFATFKSKKPLKQKNLFKRFVSHIIFRNILQFLSTQDIKQLRLTSVFTNYLIEHNISFLYFLKVQRIIYLESLNIKDFKEPVIPDIRNSQKSLKKLISQNIKFHKIPQQLLSYLNLIITLYSTNNWQKNVQKEYFSKFDLLQTVIKYLKNKSLNWYGLVEKDQRILKAFISKKFNKKDQINSKDFNDLKQYIQNLFDFTTRSDYKLISDAYNKDQLLEITQCQQLFLKNLQKIIESKQNKLRKISTLGNMFFKIILSYCPVQDILNSRLVCMRFNQEFQQNTNYHYQMFFTRISRQINQIQSNYNLSLTQDEFLQKPNDSISLIEIFCCIQKNVNLNNNVNTKDLLQINSEQVAEFIFQSQQENELHKKCRNLIIERLGMDILVKNNYGIFQQKLEKVKQFLIEYYIKLPQLQKQLLIIKNLQSQQEI